MARKKFKRKRQSLRNERKSLKKSRQNFYVYKFKITVCENVTHAQMFIVKSMADTLPNHYQQINL